MTKALWPDLSSWCDQPDIKKQLHCGSSTLHHLFLCIPTPLSSACKHKSLGVCLGEVMFFLKNHFLSVISGASLLKLLHFRVVHLKAAASFWLSWAEKVWSWNPLPCSARRGFILQPHLSSGMCAHLVCRAALLVPGELPSALTQLLSKTNFQFPALILLSSKGLDGALTACSSHRMPWLNSQKF